MSEEIILPKGYTRVNNIGGYGTQYIDLPVNTVEGDVVELVTVQRFIELSRQAEGKNGDFYFGIQDNKTWYASSGPWGNGMEKTVLADTEWHTFRLKYTPNSSDGGFWVDDEKLRDCNGTDNVLPTYISVFKTYNGNFYTKCYKKLWKLYVNDVLRYDLIPCLDNNGVLCMYDLVGDKTYYNQGTGNFSYMIPYPDNEDYESELPAGYTKCLYLQSDGTQYINTSIYKDINGNNATSTEAGIIPTDETGLYIKAQRLNYGNYVPFGSNGSSSPIYPPRIDTSSTKRITYGWKAYTAASITWDKGDDLIYSSSINLYNDRSIHFNSEDSDWDGYITESLGSVGFSIGLFSINDGGTFLGSIGKWGGRIYRAKITQGTELIRDFVPCLDASGVPCMYDLINGGSYYNQGNGSNFEYCIDHKLPSDFAKLKYLEATGTQYINTNYIPQAIDNGDGTYTVTTGLYVDTYNVTASDAYPIGCLSNGAFFYSHRIISNSTSIAYGWGAWTGVSSSSSGRVSYQSKLNFLNDKKAVLEAPMFSMISSTLGNISAQSILPIYMFGLNSNNALKYPWNGRIYRVKISEGTEIVRDYVPAYDTRLLRPCMYDIINNVAYYNDGTDEFLYDRQFEGDYVGFTQIGGVGNRVGGYYLELPLGYIDALFLENTGSQYIDTKLQTYSDSVISTTVQQVYAIDTNTGTYAWFFGSVHNPGMNIGFSVTEYRYSSILGYDVIGNKGGNMRVFADKRYDILNITNTENQFIINGKTAIPDLVNTHAPVPDSKLTYPIFAYISSSAKIGINRGCRIFSFSDNTPSQGGNRLDLVAVIDANGVPCMYDKITQKPFYNEGDGSFIVGLTKNQARKLYKLPPTTNGTLTISLPASIVDTDGITITDTIVKSAKEKAEENGWRFTIQTYTE